MRSIFFFLIFLIVIQNVTALAMSPIGHKINYVPGSVEQCNFNLKDNEGGLYNFRVEGDLNASIKLKSESIELKPEEWKTIECAITLPENLIPGPHSAKVISVQGGSAGGNVGAISGLILPIEVFVPYPGKYLEIKKFEIKNIAVNETQKVKINVISRGAETINKAISKIEIFSKENKVKEITTNEIKLEKNQEGELTADFNSEGMGVGSYNAIATVNYDGKEVKIEKEFKIGDIIIELETLGPYKIKANTVAKFNIKLDSKWNSEINDVYVMLTIYDKTGISIDELKSETFGIGSWQALNKVIYWDMKGKEAGNYKANFTVYYSGQKNTGKQMDFEIYESFMDKYYVTNVLLGLIILLLIVNLIRTYIKNKKNENK